MVMAKFSKMVSFYFIIGGNSGLTVKKKSRIEKWLEENSSLVFLPVFVLIDHMPW